MYGSEKSVGMDVKPEEIQELLEFFSKNTYKAKDTHPKVQSIMKKCLGLFALDYNYSILPNNGGELSTNYPSSLVILESEKTSATGSPSSVTKSCNGISNSTKSVHFMDNGSAASNNGPISQSTKSNGNGGSPSSVCFMKTEDNNGDVVQDHDANDYTEQYERSRGKCAKLPGINEFGKEKQPSPIPSAGATLTEQGLSSYKDDPDLNSVFIETTDISLDAVDPLAMNSDFSSSNRVDLPINLGDSCVTSSTISDFDSVVTENAIEVTKLKDLCSRARFARCRARFPIPVILYNQKHICRSATLSGGPEIYGRSSFDYLFSGGIDWKQYTDDGDDEIIVSENQSQSEWQLFDRVRSQDIKLLKVFQVQTIVDLMVEKKKVKFGVYVTSSEKVDKENRYSDFTITSLPYPGCEFFKKYRDNGYNGEDLIFEWNQTHVDADIFVPADRITTSLNTDWTAYRKWDVVVLTQEYLKLLLAYLRDGENGLLIHCISGWDRTPLFVSLLRMSLWADGVIHKSLCAEQILYLTLAYDWLLFGHNLEDRLNKGEEIMFFCFYFLKYIVPSEFNVDRSKEVPKSQQLTRSRNDSDVQLDGVLLEGGLLTSPEGSSWSLSSCSSTSDKSIDNPPAYFNVEPESWDESLGAQHLNNHRKKNLREMETSFAHDLDHDGQDETGCPFTKKNFGSESSAHQGFSNSSVICDGFNGNHKLSLHDNSNQCTNSLAAANFETAAANSPSPSGLTVQNGNSSGAKRCEGRTSPVAVPRSNRTAHHRHESSSSASIGSWQFITGTGSLRETISSSDPGSSHSHPSRLSLSSAIECIETSESSCTLVEELTPIEFPERHPLASFDSNYDVPINGSKSFGDNMERKSNLTESAVLKGSQSSTSVSKPSSTNSQSLSGSYPQNGKMTRRRERLQTVRAHFYSLYSTSIGFQFKNGTDNGSGGGLGSLIGNFATKVGIRSAHRHMS